MLQKVSRTLFFLIIFSLPFQVGYHFWPSFSYITGVRVDYLSPTLYLLDILILLWIGTTLLLGKNKPEIKVSMILFLFLLSLVWNIFAAKSPDVHIFGLLKLAEFGLFGFLVAANFHKDDIPIFVRTLALSAIISSSLAVWQFINQSSVGSLWYFIGERTFNSATIGISTVNLDQQLLRAYAAFPHPNVLAFFLLMSSAFMVFRIPNEEKAVWKVFLMSAVVLSAIGIVLTFSRVAIVLLITFFIYAIYAKGKRNLKTIWPGFFVFMAVLAVGIYFLPQEFLLRGIDFREELFRQAYAIFQSGPYFGIGLNNFFIHQAALIKDISPIIFQPPHNIYVLSLLSLGIMGWWIVPGLLIWSVGSVTKKLRTTNYELRTFFQSTLFVLISIILAGMFDHFFLTVEQGQLIFALLLGLSFVTFKESV